MPELPEVEAARRSLARALRGRTIDGITRQGKALRFDVGPWILVFHYMLSALPAVT